MNLFRFKIFGNQYETRVLRRDKSEVVLSVNGQEYKVYLEPTRERELAHPTPKLLRSDVVHGPGPQRTAPPDAPKGAGVVRAPLPGLVLRVLVAPGAPVKRGQQLCVTEAMKMENSIASPVDGIVDTVSVAPGDAILEGQELIRIRTE